MSQIGTVYLVHFERRLAHAQHYIGWTQAEEVRIKRHRDGRGSRLLAAVQREGIPWAVVRRWRGSRVHERYLKKQRHAPQFCPVCSKRPRSPAWVALEFAEEKTTASVKEFETLRFRVKTQKEEADPWGSPF